MAPFFQFSIESRELVLNVVTGNNVNFVAWHQCQVIAPWCWLVNIHSFIIMISVVKFPVIYFLENLPVIFPEKLSVIIVNKRLFSFIVILFSYFSREIRYFCNKIIILPICSPYLYICFLRYLNAQNPGLAQFCPTQ